RSEGVGRSAGESDRGSGLPLSAGPQRVREGENPLLAEPGGPRAEEAVPAIQIGKSCCADESLSFSTRSRFAPGYPFFGDVRGAGSAARVIAGINLYCVRANDS